jgi:preprotein translocase subunit Sec61beta
MLTYYIGSSYKIASFVACREEFSGFLHGEQRMGFDCKAGKNLTTLPVIYGPENSMARRETSSSGGLMSSAGLMRYFEAEESAIKLDPRSVVIAAVGLGAIVWLCNVFIAHVI